ncbi:lck-interacting transmembrane adapter 1 isoform X2 [Antechinus flavipes]|uniref:lck-interacting transmembrane adapter 1 isoform X2 n=1 Tax=Antechinus flavipes TaxID=38775 RepID=UPI002235AB35|nr:lck-interacting transmembrane adapter 1 isoform X2 [Antechinus flavipes]
MAVVQAVSQSQSPPVLWVLSCLALVLMLCALCTTCHRKGKRKQQSSMKLVNVTQLRSLSKSDSKLHELNRGPRTSKAQRPISIDLLYPRWPGGIRADIQVNTVPPVFIHRELPQPPLASDYLALGSTYSNVRLAATPSGPPMTERGEEQLRTSEKLVEVLYSKISRLGRKPLEPTGNRALCNKTDRDTQAPLMETTNEQSQSPAINFSYRTGSPTWGKNTGNGHTENFYESISEMEGLGQPRLPSRAQTHKPSGDI